jgi:copper(I)-binding protein
MGSNRRAALLLLLMGTSAGCPLPEKTPGEVSVDQVQLRMAPGGATSAAVYFTLRNSSQTPDTLNQVTTPAGVISLHSTMIHDDGTVMMTPMARVAIPASTTLVFKVGERHGMLEQFSHPLAVNDSIALTFTFARRTPIAVWVRVQAVDAEE